MEFETEHKAVNNDVSDEQRQAALTKQVTLTPLHETVEPEAPSDEYATNRVEEPVANIPSDSESTHSVATPASESPAAAPAAIALPAPRSNRTIWIIGGCVIAVAIVAGAAFVLNQ